MAFGVGGRSVAAPSDFRFRRGLGLVDAPERRGLAILIGPAMEEWELLELAERLRTANRELKKLYTERGELQRRVTELEELLEGSRSA